MSDFEEDFNRLRSEPEEVYHEVEQYHSLLLSRLEDIFYEAEKDIPDSPWPIDLNIHTHKYRVGAVTDLIAYGIAHHALETDSPHLIKEFKQLNPKRNYVKGSKMPRIASLAEKYYQNPEESFNSRPWFSPDLKFFPVVKAGKITIANLPEEFFTGELAEIPGIIKPFIEEEIMYEDESHGNPLERLKAIINHEMTHAYIFFNTNIFKQMGDEKAQELNEAAAQAATNIRWPSQEGMVELYQETGQSRAYQQFFRLLYLTYADRFDSPEEKIYRIRERSAEAFTRIYKQKLLSSPLQKLPFVDKMSLVEIILDDEDEELLTAAKVIWYLEQAEQAAFHPLVLLNIFPPKETRSHISKIDNELDSAFAEPLESLFPKGAYINENKNKGIVGKVASVTEDSLPQIGELDWEKTEFESTLKEMEKGLEDLRKLQEDSRLSSEESQEVKKTADEIEEALNYYMEEKKLERSRGKELAEKYGGRVEEVVDFVKERVYRGDQTDPIRISDALLKELSGVTGDYETVIEVGRKYNKKILEALDKLHSDEEKVAKIVQNKRREKQYRELHELLQITSRVHNIVKQAEEEFEYAEKMIKKAEESIEEVQK